MKADASSIDQAAQRASSWLFDTAMPLWLERGVDWDRGGFYESLSVDSLQPATAFKRLRVLTRQIYVFSEGALNGVPRAEDAVHHGLAFLLEQARHPEGGFASRQDMDGTIIDATRDLYDLAFVLFAFAHAYRVTRDQQLKIEAIALAGFIQSEMRHPAGGFVEALPERSLRRQNPHMHLLEACLACLEHMADAVFEGMVDELIGLCRSTFLNVNQDCLFEYFEEDLSAPLRRDGLAVTEPGHHMEWAWLFEEVRRVRGVTETSGASLAQFALDRGLDRETGMLRGEVYEDGAISNLAVRLWPHGEWLKAALRVDAVSDTWNEAWRAMERFLDTPIPGVWYEQWDPRANGFQVAPAPASSLYHITTAIMELRRAARS